MESTLVIAAEPAVAEEETVAVEQPTPKRTRKSKTTTSKNTKPRDLEVLKYTEVKAMTEKEKEIVINAQADEISFLKAQNEALKHNCETAYEKVRIYEDDFNKMDAFYKSKLMFVTEQMNAFAKTIKLATTGGMN